MSRAFQILGIPADAEPLREAAEMPLSHFVPQRFADRFTPRVLAKDYLGSGAPRACFFLGPGRVRRRKPGPGQPYLALLFKPAVEGADWFAFPWDLGGAHVRGHVVDETLWRMTQRSWRAYLSNLLVRTQTSWRQYVRAELGRGEVPAALGLSSSDDPAGWTPEVCSPTDVPLVASSVAAAGLLLDQLAVDEKSLSAVNDVCHQLQQLGIAIDHPREQTDRARVAQDILIDWSEAATVSMLEAQSC